MTEADVLTRMLHAVDARDWTTVGACLADEIRTDYTQLWGGEPTTVRAPDLIADWQRFVTGLSATQHITGPILLADGHLHTHVVAHHWLDDAIWTVHGHYVATVAGGRITQLTLQLFHLEGNLDVPAVAAGRTPVGTPATRSG